MPAPCCHPAKQPGAADGPGCPRRPRSAFDRIGLKSINLVLRVGGESTGAIRACIDAGSLSFCCLLRRHSPFRRSPNSRPRHQPHRPSRRQTKAKAQTGAQAGRRAGKTGRGKACRGRRRPGEAPWPIRRLGRLYRIARRQEGLLCHCQADSGYQSAQPAAQPDLHVHFDAAGGQGRQRGLDHHRLSVQARARTRRAQVGSTSFALYTQQDGAWIKNAAEEAQMVDAMQPGDTVIVKGVSAKARKPSTPTLSRDLPQALDRVAPGMQIDGDSVLAPGIDRCGIVRDRYCR